MARAAFNLRMLGVAVVSDATLREAIADWANWEAEYCHRDNYVEPPFEVLLDRKMSFRLRVRGNDPTYTNIVRALSETLPDKNWTINVVDPVRPFNIPSESFGGGESLIADASELAGLLPQAHVHDFSRRTTGAICVTMVELEEVAKELDDVDAQSPERIPANFVARLRDDVGG
jgi:hypothetical protein